MPSCNHDYTDTSYTDQAQDCILSTDTLQSSHGVCALSAKSSLMNQHSKPGDCAGTFWVL